MVIISSYSHHETLSFKKCLSMGDLYFVFFARV